MIPPMPTVKNSDPLCCIFC